MAQDGARAAAYYLLGCARSHAPSCVALGEMYKKGKGVARDAGEAERMFMAACRHDASTCRVVGELWLRRGVAGARVRALMKRACEGGDEDACDDGLTAR